MSSELTTFLHDVPLMAGLDEGELAALAAAFVPQRFAAGATIFFEGEAGRDLYLIVAGQVRVYVLGEDGQEQSVGLLGPREVFGELAVIDERPRSASVVAVTPTLALTLSRERVHELVERAPRFTLNLLRLLSERVRGTTDQLGSLVFLNLPTRLARTLLELAAEHGLAGDEGVRVRTTLTQSELASLVGASRERTNKALRALQRAGLIVMREGQIVIPNLVALAEWGR
jgi:CRP/FNR family transcriptional regulator, cyclic AMP receptor protein